MFANVGGGAYSAKNLQLPGICMREPNIIYSGLSRNVRVDGLELRIEIYRLEDEHLWALEVVDAEDTSTVWDEQFRTDQDALDAVELVIREEGSAAFRDNVIPFRKR